MRTTVGELRKMLEDMSDSQQIVMKVRCNSTEDYEENSIIAYENEYGVVIIKDKLSY